MGQEYSFEVIERAEQLYCVDGQTFEAVATLTGVAASTLKRWAEKYGWPAKKEEIRQAMASIRANTIKLRARLIENCMSTLNAMDAFAVASLEGMAQKAAQLAAKGQAAQASPEKLRPIRTDEDAVAALEEAVQMRLNSILSDPQRVSLPALRDIKGVLDLLREMRAKTAGSADPASTGLTPEAADEIRRKILGVTK